MMWAAWIIGVIVLVAGLSYFFKKGIDVTSDDGPMSMAARRFLVGYLLITASVLAYCLVKLFSVTFPEDQFTRQQPPTFDAAKAPADKAVPSIVELDPSTVVAGSPLPSLVVYGYNFTDHSKVRLNGAERLPQFSGGNSLLVPIRPSDLANSGVVWIEVTNENKTSAPSELEVRSSSDREADLWIFGRNTRISPETRLVLLVLLAGALGSYVHAVKSLADFLGNRTLTASWFWWYITRPFLGMPLAFIFYAALRGGFLVGIPADAKTVSPYGAFSVAALVGMFADKASQKLGELFDTLFKTDDSRKDKLAPALTIKSLEPATVAVGSLPPILSILGENLGTTKSVRINAEDRQPASVSSNKVTIKLKPDDVAKSGKLSVAVVADSGVSPAVTLHVTDLAITVAALPPAKVKSPYTQTLAGAGGIGPYHWSAQNLPGGLKVSDSGTLAGMPEKEGSLSVTLTLSDSTDATVSKQIMLQVDP